MKKYKYLIVAALFAMAVPPVFWWGVGRGREIDAVFVTHGKELIRLQKDIKGLQLHVAELNIKNHRLKSRLESVQKANLAYQEKIRIIQRR